MQRAACGIYYDWLILVVLNGVKLLLESIRMLINVHSLLMSKVLGLLGITTMT